MALACSHLLSDAPMALGLSACDDDADDDDDDAEVCTSNKRM